MSEVNLSVRSKTIPTSFIAGSMNALPFSSTVVTILDKTERPLPRINTAQYSVFQPIFSPKGVTNEVVYITGQDVLNKYNDLFGKPNTVLYGPGATYIWQAVRGGFNAGVVNVRPADATYANFFVNFMIEKSDKQQKLFVRKYAKWAPAGGITPGAYENRDNSVKYGYHFALVPAGADAEAEKKAKASIGTNATGNPEDDPDIKEILLDTYDFGFKYFNITGLTQGKSVQVDGLTGITIDTNFGSILSTNATYPKKNTAGKYEDANGQTQISDNGVMRDLKISEAAEVTESDDRTEVHPNTKGLKVPFNMDAKMILSLPVFGLVYRGAGEYGNVFYADFSTKSSPLPIDRNYPYFKCEVRENAIKSEHMFDFTLFAIGDQNGGSLNYNFADRAIRACRKTWTETNNTKTFTPYLVNRTNALSIETGLKTFFTKLRETFLAKIKAEFSTDSELDTLLGDAPTTDIDTIKNFNTVLAEINALEEDFKRNKDVIKKKTIETPFSRIAPWELNPIDDLKHTYRRKTVPGINLLNLPTRLYFAGGTYGSLTPIVGEEEFDFYTTVYNPYAVTAEEKKAEEDAIRHGQRGTYKIWLELYKDVFLGNIDDAIFDPTIVKDCIVFGEGYPEELQRVVSRLVQYKEDFVHKERVRPDWTYIRTPDETVVRNMNDAIAWAHDILGDFKEKNIGMHPVIGSWMFTDPTTGGSYRYSGFFEYLGESSSLASYLLSGTSNSFASGDYSKIFGGADDSQELIPRTSEQKTDLVKADVMYYRRRSDGRYALGEDLGYNPGMMSSLKNIGSCIHFNRILNEAQCFMIDNVISNTDRDSLDLLQKGIEKRIAPYTKHFNNRVVVEVKVSDEENEQENSVILVEISVTGHEYSRNNRLAMIMTSDKTNAA